MENNRLEWSDEAPTYRPTTLEEKIAESKRQDKQGQRLALMENGRRCF